MKKAFDNNSQNWVKNDNELDSRSTELAHENIMRTVHQDIDQYRQDQFNTGTLSVGSMAVLIGANYRMYGQDLADVIQDAKVSTWIRVKDLPLSHFDSFNIAQYFLACVRSESIKLGKYRSKHNSEDIDDMVDEDLPFILHQDEIPDFLMDNARLIAAIRATISEEDFRIFELFGVFSKSHEEIAQELGFKTTSTVSTRINRVRDKLKSLRKKGRL